MTDLATHYLDEARRQMRGNKRLADAAIANSRAKNLFRDHRCRGQFRCHPRETPRRKHALAIHRFPHFRRREAQPFSDQEFELNAQPPERRNALGGKKLGQVFPLDATQARRRDAHRDHPRRAHTVLQAINARSLTMHPTPGQFIFLSNTSVERRKTLSIPREVGRYKRSLRRLINP